MVSARELAASVQVSLLLVLQVATAGMVPPAMAAMAWRAVGPYLAWLAAVWADQSSNRLAGPPSPSLEPPRPR